MLPSYQLLRVAAHLVPLFYFPATTIMYQPLKHLYNYWCFGILDLLHLLAILNSPLPWLLRVSTLANKPLTLFLALPLSDLLTFGFSLYMEDLLCMSVSALCYAVVSLTECSAYLLIPIFRAPLCYSHSLICSFPHSLMSRIPQLGYFLCAFGYWSMIPSPQVIISPRTSYFYCV